MSQSSPGAVAAGKIAWFMNILRDSRKSGKDWKLIDLMHRCRIACATDGRDYVYGLLGLSLEADEKALRPDYSEDLVTTYLRFADYSIRAGEGLKVLYNAGSMLEGLPSLIPDWTDKTVPSYRLCPEPHARENRQLAFAAGSTYPPVIRQKPGNSRILFVQGICFDTISKLAPRRRIASTSDVGSVNYMIDVRRSAHDLQELIRTANCPRYITEDVESVTWKTLIANTKNGLQEVAGPEYADYYRAFNIGMNALDESWPEIDPTDEEVRDPQAVAWKSSMFVKGASELCHSKVRGITKLGLPGQFPLNAHEGDFVFIPCGSTVPFVVRACPGLPSSYRWIGECYVHGIMEGQAFAENEADIQSLQII